MSVNYGKRRNVGILAGLILATVVLVFVGTQYLRTSLGWNLVGEVAYAFLIIILVLFAYDTLLVR